MDIDTTIRVYAKPDALGNITAVNSSIFLSDTTDWIEIDSGTGDRYAHAQGNYFDKPIVTESGVFRYRLVDGSAVEKTAEEIAAEASTLPQPEPTVEQDLLSMTLDHECRLSLLELGV